MNHKQIAIEIYSESRKLPTCSEATRYRKQAISCFPQPDRVAIKAHMDNIGNGNHVSGRSPATGYNARAK